MQRLQWTREYPDFRFQLPLAMAMARTNKRESRVRSILDGSMNRSSWSPAAIGGLAMTFFAMLLPLAVLNRESRVQAMDPPNDQQTTLLYEVVADSQQIELDGKLFVDARLTNTGDDPVKVYWGDYAFPKMYTFDIQHVASQRRVLTTRIPVWYRDVPKAVDEKYFKTIQPGQTISYKICLSSAPGANCQRTFFRSPGKHLITPSLHVTTNQVLDKEAGLILGRTDAWTGTLSAEPFTIEVLDDDVAPQQETKVTGIVVTEKDQPTAGAIVQLYHRVPSFGSKDGTYENLLDQTYSGEDGTFTFQRVPTDSMAYRLTAWSPLQPLGSVTIENDRNAKLQDVKIKLNPGVTIRGRVVDEHGQPLADVRVSQQTRTAADGTFALTAAAGSEQYSVDLWRSGHVGISSAVDRDTATSGNWQIVMYSEQSLRVQGQAVFADGTPVAKAKILVKLKQLIPQATPNQRWTQITGDTDAAGNFQITLPDPVEYSAVATAQAPNKYGFGREWYCEIAKLARAGKPLKLVFENGGQIEVQIKHQGKLPAEKLLNINCVSLRNQRLMVQRKEPADTTQLTIDDLAPGDYRLDVAVERAGYETSAKVTIPATPPRVASTTIAIPELSFGDITAKFMMPDGKTPAAHVRLWIQSAGGGLGATTDEDGVLTARQLRAGDIQLTPRGEQGVAEAPILGHKVVGNQRTDLGTIRLLRVDEAFGWFEGTLKYDDGQRIPSARIPGLSIGVAGGTMMPSGLQAQPVVNGRFRVRLPKGQHGVLFDLGPVLPEAGWVSSMSSGTKRLIADAEILPGETIRRDLVLKQRPPHASTVTVTWDEAAEQSYQLIAVVPQDGFRWVHQLFSTNNAKSHTLKDVPAGKCFVSLRGHQQPYFAVRSVDTDAAQQKIVFEPETSSVSFVVIDENGQQMRDLGLVVYAMMGGSPVYAVGIAAGSDDGRRRATDDSMFKELDDGTIVISGLAKGAYRATITSGDWKDEHTFELFGADAKLQINRGRQQ